MEQTRQAAGEKAVLAGLDAACFTKEETASEVSLTELQALLETAGGECVGKVLQSRPTPDPHSFVGQGKAEEIRDLVKETGAKLVIFDNDLTPSQIKALEGLTGASVLDRSALILDIFAQRAKTREGKLQVELAQYQYYLPRLTVWNETMGRLGGGIGTRGPGETQLDCKVDYIITHCAPTAIQQKINANFKPDKLTDFLEEIRNRSQFHYWLFGHYHDNRIIDEKYVLLYEQMVQIL